MTVEPVLETLHEMLAATRAREGTVPPFDPSSSPLHGKAIFVVGAPRSGTTWLHQLLATHPDVATGGEAHVFCEGVSALLRNHEDPDPHMKLSTWLPRPELLALVRAFTDGVFDTARRVARPGATRFLDKTPNHAPYAADVAEVYPDATYVHIVRDARDSVSSQRDLWAGWEPRLRAWDQAARGWVDSVEDCRRHLAGLRYHEVRYEDLVGDTEAGLAEILRVAGLEHDEAFVAEAVRFGRAPINVRPSDARVGVRKWAGTDPRGERAVVAVAGDLLVALGYLDDAERAAILAERSWQDVVDDGTVAARRFAEGAARRVARAARRARDRGPRPRDRRIGAEALYRAASAGDPAAVRVAPGATLEVDGAAAVSGGPAVAAWLVANLVGARLAASDADRDAAALQVVEAGGRRRLVRLYGDPERPERVVVQG